MLTFDGFGTVYVCTIQGGGASARLVAPSAETAVGTVMMTWFLKKLKRAAVSVKDLVYHCQAVSRLVLEYTCPVWHSSLTKGQTKTIEDVQHRVFQVILGNVV